MRCSGIKETNYLYTYLITFSFRCENGNNTATCLYIGEGFPSEWLHWGILKIKARLSADRVGNEHSGQILTRSVHLEVDDNSSHWLPWPLTKKSLYVIRLNTFIVSRVLWMTHQRPKCGHWSWQEMFWQIPVWLFREAGSIHPCRCHPVAVEVFQPIVPYHCRQRAHVLSLIEVFQGDWAFRSALERVVATSMGSLGCPDFF